MGGERQADAVREDIAVEGVQIAQLLDSQNMQEANERLRRASFEMSPEDFHKLVTVVDDVEQPQQGADLILDSPDLERHNLQPGSRDGRVGPYQNQTQYRHGNNGRHLDDATRVTIMAQDVNGLNWQADVAIMRSSVDPLQASPYLEPAQYVGNSVRSGDVVRDEGVRMAEALDAGYPDEVLERLRQDSFGSNSPAFMQKVTMIDGIEHKGYGADLFLTRVQDSGQNYFNRRDRDQGRFQNQSRWDGRHDRGGDARSYPISETLVSIIQPNKFDGNGATEFLRSDIAIMRTSVQPLDAVFRAND